MFYGQVKDDNFRRQMKENHKIEELILTFATNATNVLKKDPSLAGDKRKSELNNRIALFVKLLGDCLRGLSHVSPELTQRLDAYTTKLAPQQQSGTPYSDSGYDSSSTNRDRDPVAAPNRISRNIVDMPLVLTVARLFKIPEPALQGEVDQISKFCTEKVNDVLLYVDCANGWFIVRVALTDLKVRPDKHPVNYFSLWGTRRVSRTLTLVPLFLVVGKTSSRKLHSNTGEPSKIPTFPLNQIC